ncbi:MAG: hypothetical protein HY927_05225 [Elusimicrobia bacterium]|nr:hypothetical protein [Elusimicrobiota bacterium]
MRNMAAVAASVLLLAGLSAADARAGAAPPEPAGFEALLSQAWDSVRTGMAGLKTALSWQNPLDEQYPPRTTIVKVGKCWARPANPDADALGLPVEFCVETVGTEIHYPYHPFSRDSVMLMEGKPVAGRLHISGGAREPFGWAIVGSLLSASKPDQRCGELNVAGAAVYVGSDLEGRVLLDAPIAVRGFLFDGSSLCRTPAKSVEILYALKP